MRPQMYTRPHVKDDGAERQRLQRKQKTFFKKIKKTKVVEEGESL
jgi:hypothetical protein